MRDYVTAVAICFALDRRSESYVYNYIVPGAMIIMCSLFAFLLPICNIQNRMFLTITVMLTFLALRQIIRFSLPELSYLTQLDYYLLVGETIVFLVMVQSATMYGVLLSAAGGNIPECGPGTPNQTWTSVGIALSVITFFIIPTVRVIKRFVLPQAIE